jgi:filamentous hemagglutinin family protein
MAMSRRLLIALLLGGAAPLGAQTAIVPDTVASATTGTTAATLGNTTAIDSGTRVGNNLFHSFTTFSLAAGDVALWKRAAADGATIAHVVNRVTGGAASSIDGTLAMQDMPNASFWFVNPAGIVFGANAAIAVPNAAHFSTAGVLRLADGGSFSVATPGGSVLSVAPPSAFGFLGGQRDIAVTGAQPAFVGAGTHLSLSAANIAVSGSTFTAGSIDLAAVGTGVSSVTVADPAATRFGNGTIALTDSLVNAEPDALSSGSIRAMAARLDVTRTTFSSDSNARSAGGLGLTVGDLRMSAPVAQGAPLAYLGSFASGAGDAGPVAIRADAITLSGASQISTQALDTATGNAGNIGIDTGSLTVEGGASILSSAFGNSATGSIRIDAGAMALRSAGSIESTTYGAGQGGDVRIRAATLSLDGGRIASEAEAGSTGDAGTVAINVTGAATLTNSGIVTSTSFGDGLAGIVGVLADAITLQGGSSIQSDSIGNAGAGAGAVLIEARSVRIESNSEVSSATAGAGSGGLVAIVTRTLALATGGRISTETFAAGPAGGIGIEATDITLAGTGRIISAQTGAGASGDAGRILIKTDTLAVAPAAATAISTSVENSGQAGAIDITARTIVLDGAEIGSAANGIVGTSGLVEIRADRLDIVGGGRVETSSFGPGAAGGIALDIGTLRLQGAGSEITSENLATRGGPAGSIAITANSLQLLDGGGISTDSTTGAAGDITISMPGTSTLLLRGRGGAPGFITTSSGPGTGGIITIASPYLILSDGGAILAKGQAFGADVLIRSNFYIRSADRVNQLSVDGGLIVDSEVGDLSTGSESADLSFLDASSVLRGQCAAARTGGVSQFTARVTGPYVPLVRPVVQPSVISLETRLMPICG